jgi:hypothetical protein
MQGQEFLERGRQRGLGGFVGIGRTGGNSNRNGKDKSYGYGNPGNC